MVLYGAVGNEKSELWASLLQIFFLVLVFILKSMIGCFKIFSRSCILGYMGDLNMMGQREKMKMATASNLVCAELCGIGYSCYRLV